MFPFEPPVVNVPNPVLKPTYSRILSRIDFSMMVATGANSYVYIEVFDAAAITSPAKEAMLNPPHNGFMKPGLCVFTVFSRYDFMSLITDS